MAQVPEAARAHYVAVQRIQGRAVRAAWRGWAEVSPLDIAGSWRSAMPAVAEALTRAQVEAADAGAGYTARTLAAQGGWVPPAAFVDPAAFGGRSAAGFPLDARLYSPVPYAKHAIADGASPAQAIAQARDYLTQIVRTEVADASRVAAGVDVAVRTGVGYTRMVGPAACDRCIVLAGRWYRYNAGFLRHPRCHCVHVASAAGSLAGARAEGLLDDPYEVFRGMTEAEQDRAFGAANAQAIRDGADLYQVVNARRRAAGLKTAEGTSRRGASAQLAGRRLTPEGIYARATSRDDVVRLLTEHGYVLPGGQVPGGVLRGQVEGYGQLGRGGTRRGVARAVDQARVTGLRDPLERATMTAAERRLFDAGLRYEAVLDGRNPYGKGPLTPALAARAEDDFRRWVTTRGEVFVLD